jgi:ribosomal protein S18 acetylase RimI-like enzyme
MRRHGQQGRKGNSRSTGNLYQKREIEVVCEDAAEVNEGGETTVNMTIKYAETTDLLWLKEHEQHLSDQILETKIKSKEIYIVQENEKIIGWLRYNLFWDNIPFMNKIYFLEEFRHKGFGRKLVHHWENKMKEKGYKNVLTSTQSNEGAQHFYRKMGYTEIGGFKYINDPYEVIFYKQIN